MESILATLQAFFDQVEVNPESISEVEILPEGSPGEWRIHVQPEQSWFADPSIVDAAIAERRSKDPTASRRKQINKEIASLEAERKDLQADLLRMIRERSLDRNTEGVLTNRLKEIEKLVNQLNSELLDDEINNGM